MRRRQGIQDAAATGAAVTLESSQRPIAPLAEGFDPTAKTL